MENSGARIVEIIPEDLPCWAKKAMEEAQFFKVAADAMIELVELRGKYTELLIGVANKFDGETRHETALRYIKNAEKGSNGPEKENPEAN